MNDVDISSASIDPREVAHYTALAETWWDRTGPFWPLHTLNALRIGWIREQVQKAGFLSAGDLPLADLQVLDIGCGGGILSESLARLGAHVTGAEVVAKNVHIARAHAATSRLDIDYQLATAEAIADSGKTYDVVFNMEVVEHVADLDSFMNACNTLVKPGGMMFVASINRNWLAWLIAVFGAEYVLRWLPRGTHHYGMLRRPVEIISSLARGGLTVEEITGVTVNPFNRKMSLARHTLVNYMLCAKRVDNGQ